MAWWGQFSKQCTGKPLALTLHIHCLMGPVQQAIHSIAFSTVPERLLPWWGQFSKQCTGKPLALAVSFHCCSGASSASNAQCTFSMTPLQISSKTLCLLRHDCHSLSLFDNSYSVSSSWPNLWCCWVACSVIVEFLFCLFHHHGMSLLHVSSS